MVFFYSYIFVLKSCDGITQPHLLQFDQEFFMEQMHNILLTFMNRKIRKHIGGSIERVVEVDVQENGIGWESYLRVGTECDLHNVVAREE